MAGHDAPPDLRAILATYRTIAVVGMSKDPRKDAHTVPAYMKEHGYTVIPVNPSAAEILGERAYPSLSAIPADYDVVNLFRPSNEVEPFVDEAIREGKAKVIWMQLGIANQRAERKARNAGLHVVSNRCMRTEHMRFFGNDAGKNQT